jgi:osmoprotectant transport system permease protein
VSILELFGERWEQVIEKTLQHLALSGSACVVAVCIAVPLGMLIARVRRRWLTGLVLGGAGVIQTIPSIAMLFLLQIQLQRIGFVPAFLALVLYALLPIIRNTYTGLTGVDANILEAADGMGHTRRQRLWLIELPLASPIIMAGVRTATVITVGIATLSAFIGAGGLGDFINRGLPVGRKDLIMLGVIAASVLALLLDAIMAVLERVLKRRFRQT